MQVKFFGAVAMFKGVCANIYKEGGIETYIWRDVSFHSNGDESSERI